jgi:hypothetical protein
VKRTLAGIAGALGLVALWRVLRRQPKAAERPPVDPADELRARLEQARETADDRDEFDAAEGQPVDAVGRPPTAAEPLEPDPVPEREPEPEPEPEQTLSLDERRRAVHEKAQQALGEMDRLGRDD